MSGEFEGRIAIVTGGSSGIGLATSTALHRKGAEVIVIDKTVDGLPDYFAGYQGDVADDDSIKRVFESIGGVFGRVDILINNAGISAVGTVEETSMSEWSTVLNVNVMGIARVTSACLPYLRASDAPTVVNVSSIAALNGLPRRAAYAASKGAVLALTYAMAADYVRQGIRVNAVSPGTVSTPFVEHMLETFADPAKERAALNARQATGRMVTPEEVAGAIMYLASPLSGSTTGTALQVDGGVHHLRVRPDM